MDTLKMLFAVAFFFMLMGISIVLRDIEKDLKAIATASQCK